MLHSLLPSYHLVIDCVWGDFGNWTECSVTCGTGLQTRARTIETPAGNGGAACTGEATESRNCNTHPCPIGSTANSLGKNI